jgi:hypothetical protein
MAVRAAGTAEDPATIAGSLAALCTDLVDALDQSRGRVTRWRSRSDRPKKRVAASW